MVLSGGDPVAMVPPARACAMQKQIDRVARAVLLAVRAPALIPADSGVSTQ